MFKQLLQDFIYYIIRTRHTDVEIYCTQSTPIPESEEWRSCVLSRARQCFCENCSCAGVEIYYAHITLIPKSEELRSYALRVLSRSRQSFRENFSGAQQ